MTPINDELVLAITTATLVRLGELLVPRFKVSNGGNNTRFSVKPAMIHIHTNSWYQWRRSQTMDIAHRRI